MLRSRKLSLSYFIHLHFTAFFFSFSVSLPHSLVVINFALVDWVWFVHLPPGKALHAAFISGLLRCGFLVYAEQGVMPTRSSRQCAAIPRHHHQLRSSELSLQVERTDFHQDKRLHEQCCFPVLIPHRTCLFSEISKSA